MFFDNYSFFSLKNFVVYVFFVLLHSPYAEGVSSPKAKNTFTGDVL